MATNADAQKRKNYSEGAKKGWDTLKAKSTPEEITARMKELGRKRWEGVSKRKRTEYAKTIRSKVGKKRKA